MKNLRKEKKMSDWFEELKKKYNGETMASSNAALEDVQLLIKEVERIRKISEEVSGMCQVFGSLGELSEEVSRLSSELIDEPGGDNETKRGLK